MKGERARVLLKDDTWASCLDTIEEFFAEGWTDGLPVVPPTQDAVDRMMAAVERAPLDVIGPVPPRMGVATVQAVAATAVMAGCRPEYFPVVLAAVDAMLDERFNLNGIQATTNPATPLAIVSGPIVDELGINSSTNVFGHGHRANATIGRALRLVMTVLGGGYPETGDKSSLGQPGKYSFCIGESPSTPWAPLHADLGLPESGSAVTVIGVDSPVQFPAGGMSIDPANALMDIAEQIMVTWAQIRRGGEVLLVLNPAVARYLHDNGWSKGDIREFVFEHARVPLQKMLDRRRIAPSPGEPNEWWPEGMDPVDIDTMLPVLRRPENLVITVAGGTQAAFCACCPGWGYMGGLATARAIER